MIIECVEDKIKVWVNGVLVNYGYHATATSGQIAVQAEEAGVAFKSIDLISIKRLSEKVD